MRSSAGDSGIYSTLTRIPMVIELISGDDDRANIPQEFACDWWASPPSWLRCALIALPQCSGHSKASTSRRKAFDLNYVKEPEQCELPRA